MKCKIKTKNELLDVLKALKKEKKIIGFTNGCFDILHVGHVRYLSKAKEKCDVLVVGVNSDDSVKRLKGETRPINKEDARLEVLAALDCVDFVVLFSDDTPKDLIEEVSPDILLKGGDWDENKIAGADYVKSKGGKIEIIPFIEGYSTTRIIGNITDKK